MSSFPKPGLGSNYGSCLESGEDDLDSLRAYKSIQSSPQTEFFSGSELDVKFGDFSDSVTGDILQKSYEQLGKWDNNGAHPQPIPGKAHSQPTRGETNPDPISRKADRRVTFPMEDKVGSKDRPIEGSEQDPVDSTCARMRRRLKHYRMGICFLLIFFNSIGFQTILGFNDQLNNWNLVFWRSCFQVFISILVLITPGNKIFGPACDRGFLALHVVLTWTFVILLLFSADRLSASEISAIYFAVPAGVLAFDGIQNSRGILWNCVTFFLILVWVSAVLLLTHNVPWSMIKNVASVATNNMTALEKFQNLTSAWKPPVFALDIVNNFWPVQPRELGPKSTDWLDFIGDRRVAGLITGLLGFLIASALPSLTMRLSRACVWPMMAFDSLGSLAISAIGLCLMGQPFLIFTSHDWIATVGIVVLGFLANAFLFYMLTKDNPKPAPGDGILPSHGLEAPAEERQPMAILFFAVIIRCALESVVVFLINQTVINDLIGLNARAEDMIGLAFVSSVLLILAVFRPFKMMT